MSNIIIYHNPQCSKSRQTLQLLEEQGNTPTVIEYLIHPPSKNELKKILSLLNLSPRELMRTNEQAYKDNELSNPDLSDAELLQAMVDFPKLIERPIVVNNNKAAIGRPPENILEIL